jgi:hypothetical protein
MFTSSSGSAEACTSVAFPLASASRQTKPGAASASVHPVERVEERLHLGIPPRERQAGDVDLREVPVRHRASRAQSVFPQPGIEAIPERGVDAMEQDRGRNGSWVLAALLLLHLAIFPLVGGVLLVRFAFAKLTAHTWVVTQGDAPVPDEQALRLELAEFAPLHRVDPPFPDKARRAGLSEGRCQAEVFVGADGVPYKLVIDGCAEPFGDSAIDALMRWRWPASDEPARVTAVTVTYDRRR